MLRSHLWVKPRDSERLNYIINLSLITYKNRQKKHASRMSEDTWLKKAWYICLQHGALQITRRNTAKNILKSVQELRFPFCKSKKNIFHLRQYCLLLDTYKCGNSMIRLQICVQPIKYRESCSKHINHSIQNIVQLK